MIEVWFASTKSVKKCARVCDRVDNSIEYVEIQMKVYDIL